MSRKNTKFVNEGEFAAEVDVNWIEGDTTPGNWGPYLSPADLKKVDEVRLALRRGDVETASLYGKVFRLVPV